MYATAPWLECLCAAPILHEREAHSYSLADLDAKCDPRFFKSHANFTDLPRGAAGNNVKVGGLVLASSMIWVWPGKHRCTPSDSAFLCRLRASGVSCLLSREGCVRGAQP